MNITAAEREKCENKKIELLKFCNSLTFVLHKGFNETSFIHLVRQNSSKKKKRKQEKKKKISYLLIRQVEKIVKEKSQCHHPLLKRKPNSNNGEKWKWKTNTLVCKIWWYTPGKPLEYLVLFHVEKSRSIWQYQNVATLHLKRALCSAQF